MTNWIIKIRNIFLHIYRELPYTGKIIHNTKYIYREKCRNCCFDNHPGDIRNIYLQIQFEIFNVI